MHIQATGFMKVQWGAERNPRSRVRAFPGEAPVCRLPHRLICSSRRSFAPAFIGEAAEES